MDGVIKVTHTMSDIPGFKTSHAHEEGEILLVHSGNAHGVLHGENVRLGSRSLYIIPDGCLHKLKVVDDYLYERFSVYVRLDRLNHEERPLFSRLFQKESIIVDSGDIDFLAMSMLKYRNDTSSYKKIAIQSHIIAMVTNILHSQETKPAPVFKNKLIDDAIFYIESHITDPISLTTVSGKFKIDKNYFNTLFKAETGATVQRYIIHKRLNRAHADIEHGKRAEEAAYDSGYKDYSNFYRAYKAEFGCSPSQCQSLHQ
jgi:AraC-like DNA-binding protein